MHVVAAHATLLAQDATHIRRHDTQSRILIKTFLTKCARNATDILARVPALAAKLNDLGSMIAGPDTLLVLDGLPRTE